MRFTLGTRAQSHGRATPIKHVRSSSFLCCVVLRNPKWIFVSNKHTIYIHMFSFGWNIVLFSSQFIQFSWLLARTPLTHTHTHTSPRPHNCKPQIWITIVSNNWMGFHVIVRIGLVFHVLWWIGLAVAMFRLWSQHPNRLAAATAQFCFILYFCWNPLKMIVINSNHREMTKQGASCTMNCSSKPASIRCTKQQIIEEKKPIATKDSVTKKKKNGDLIFIQEMHAPSQWKILITITTGI